MAKDLIGELGLDTSDFEKALDRVGAKIGKQFVGQIKQIGTALGIAFSAKKIIDYVRSFSNLREEIDKTRSSLVQGGEESKRFEASIGKRAEASSDAYKRIGETVRNAFLSFKGKAATMGEELMQGMTRSVFGAPSAKTIELQKQHSEAQKTVVLGEKIIAQEDELVELRSSGTDTLGKRIHIMESEIRLTETQIEFAKRYGVENGRQLENEARVKLTEQKQALRDLKLNRDLEVSAAKAAVGEITAQLQGYSEIGKAAKVITELEIKRTIAVKEGKYELAEQLRIQKEIASGNLAVAEHNMTPAQRRAERTAARKFARDVKKTTDHDWDLELRYRKAVRQRDRITPGSELDRYAQRRNKMAVANGVGAAANGGAIDPQLANTYNKDGLTALKDIVTNTAGMFKMK